MIPDKTHPHPGTAAPTRNYTCLNCGRHATIKGQWSVYTGRWLMAYDCQHCEIHQETFVSESRNGSESPRVVKQPFAD